MLIKKVHLKLYRLVLSGKNYTETAQEVDWTYTGVRNSFWLIQDEIFYKFRVWPVDWKRSLIESADYWYGLANQLEKYNE